MNHPAQSGATLIELVVAIVIITATAGTIVGLLAMMSRNSADTMVQAQSASIANAYLNEILAQPVVDTNGPTAVRANANSIDDYLTCLPDTAVRDRYGNAVANLGNYSVSVAISQPTLSATPAAPLGAIPSADTRLVRVTVVGPMGDTIVISGFKTRVP